MYNKLPFTKTTLNVNESYEGETIETKVQRIMSNKEPITDGAPIIYTDRKDGVDPMHNIRSDRFDLAIEHTDYITKSKIATREQGIGERTYDTMTPEQQAAFNQKFPENKHAKAAAANNSQGTEQK